MRRAASLLSLAMLAVSMLLMGGGPVRAGTIQLLRYRSDALGRVVEARVYVPAGVAPADGWPWLVLLHGLHGSANDWPTLGGIGDTLDRMIASRIIQPMIVAMPEGDSSWYVDSAAVGGPGNYETAIARDLPRAIAAAFPVGLDRAHRAIAGVSMGGYGALRLALRDPQAFAAVAALSPAIWQNIPAASAGGGHDRAVTPPYFQKLDPATVTIGVDLPPPGEHFGAAFGTPFDPARFNAANVFTLLEQDVEAHRRLPPIFLSVGDDDSHGLWRGSIALFETMEMNKLDLDFRVTNGDHAWSVWRTSVVEALTFVDAHFDRPPVR